MSVHYTDATVTVHHGDCLDVLRELPDASVDAVVTDPPAGIGFMGRGWDHHKGGREQWSAWLAEVMRECYRVAKPGAHAFVWALPRTSHWTACGIEDAGWEIRDRVVHLFGTGFPKSHNLPGGLGTALKPAAEDWWLARKPLAGTVASNVLRHGTGALNIDATRIGDSQWDDAANLCASCAAPAGRSERPGARARRASTATKPVAPTTSGEESLSPVATSRPATGCSDGTRAGNTSISSSTATSGSSTMAPSLTAIGSSTTSTGTSSTTASRTCISCSAPITQATTTSASRSGRWPSNVVLDESQAAELDQQSGERPGFATQRDLTAREGTDGSTSYGKGVGRLEPGTREGFNDTGGASRFFYVAKADASERVRIDGTAHPTVKPLALTRWLVRLVTPPGGTVLEPFAGSGTTVEACILEGFRCIAIEREADYLPLILQRIHRRRDPVAAVRGSGEDGGLFDLLGEEETA